MTKTHEELKPCPFCGSRDELVAESLGNNDWFVECDSCRMSLHAYHQTKESAIKHWNSRQAESVDVEALKVEVDDAPIAGAMCKGWNDCIDHLASNGYLRGDNREAKQLLDEESE